MMPVRYAVTLAHDADFTGWRSAARRLDANHVQPGCVQWRCEGDPQPDFLLPAARPYQELPKGNATRTVPGAFVSLAQKLICHSADDRFTLAYRLFRRLREEPQLLSDAGDDDMHRAHLMAKAVSRDAHKMKAFVRFREVTPDQGADDRPHFVAWFEPDHHIVDATAPFFMRRFAGQSWSILTPERCAHWDGEILSFTPGVPRSQAPAGDPAEDLWRTYFASTFNPARLMVKAMTAEMPKKYWKNLPEAQLIDPLIADAQKRHQAMQETAPRAPARSTRVRRDHEAGTRAADAPIRSLDDLAAAGRSCTRCPLHCGATQAVPGEGPGGAPLMLVGEQPGDHEDIAGKPFVGPAGDVLNDVLCETGILRDRAFVTNAVKHFKFELRGRRRLHRSPDAGEVAHCRWWLAKELELVRPRVVVALGVTAARALTGRTVTLNAMRGAVHKMADGAQLVVTNHPSALLRQRNAEAARQLRGNMLDDLRTARRCLEAAG